ncbi:hypothetical protein QE152_g40359 [Popillia japonica]|uniref:Uncharacterized protein n=1 Tax=Popillia japonica TaxID=7064 RepID=A0AAW1HRD1_POPJA
MDKRIQQWYSQKRTIHVSSDKSIIKSDTLNKPEMKYNDYFPRNLRKKEYIQELLSEGAEDENGSEQQVLKEEEPEEIVTIDELKQAIGLMLKIYNRIRKEEGI